jgi:hypothetical protein
MSPMMVMMSHSDPVGQTFVDATAFDTKRVTGGFTPARVPAPCR